MRNSSLEFLHTLNPLMFVNSFLYHSLIFTDCTSTEQADMIFMVDGSSSITPNQYDSMKRFMSSLVNTTHVGRDHVRFGAIIYSDKPKAVFTLDDYTTPKEVRSAIANLEQPGGNTFTGEGLTFARQYFDQQYGGRRERNVTQILFVITDGQASDHIVLPVAARAILEQGVMIYGIGVKGADVQELEDMTKDKRRVFFVNDYEALEGLHKNISEELCKDVKPGKSFFDLFSF